MGRHSKNKKPEKPEEKKLKKSSDPVECQHPSPARRYDSELGGWQYKCNSCKTAWFVKG